MSRSHQSSGAFLAMRLSQGLYDNRRIVVSLGGGGRCPTVPLSLSITAGVGPMEGVIKLGRKTFRDHGCWVCQRRTR